MKNNKTVINNIESAFRFNDNLNLLDLRDCQREAYIEAIHHYSGKDHDSHTLIQLPTGTGKSALIAVLPFGLSQKKTLIIVPNLTLAKQLERDLDHINNPNENIYTKRNIFTKNNLVDLNVYALRLESNVNFSDIEDHQIIIANYQQLNDVEKWFKDREDAIDLIIIDEAHHQKAETYQEIMRFFNDAKIIGLTATPFRSDGKMVDGKNIYTYHFRDAIKNKYIRNINVSNVSPHEIELVFSDKENKTYSLEDIVVMKEDACFRRGIALSQDCCDSIASKAVEKLNQLKLESPNCSHQIIAAAISIRHAREFVKPAFEKLGLKIGIVSSDDKGTNADVLKKLKQEKIDVIINIGMLGEGFDHSKLGVAAIFRPFATLNPYIQFIGRVIRKNEDCKNSFVVSHLGLNQSSRFNEFKLFDSDDKDFMQSLLAENGLNRATGDDSFVEDSCDPTNSNEFEQGVLIELGRDVVEFESQFIKDDNVITDIERLVNELSEEGRQKFYEKFLPLSDSLSVKRKRSLRPIDERKALKKLLNEKEKSIAVDVLKILNLKFRDRNFTPMYDNFTWVKKKASKLANKCMGIKSNTRNDLNNRQIQEFIESQSLVDIKAKCIEYFSEKLNSSK